MLEKPEVHPDSVNGRLPDDFATTKEEIRGKWSKRGRGNPVIIHPEAVNATGDFWSQSSLQDRFTHGKDKC